jgi:hypothetical protein
MFPPHSQHSAFSLRDAALALRVQRFERGAVTLHDFTPFDLERRREDAILDREVLERHEQALRAFIALEMLGVLVELALEERDDFWVRPRIPDRRFPLSIIKK